MGYYSTFTKIDIDWKEDLSKLYRLWKDIKETGHNNNWQDEFNYKVRMDVDIVQHDPPKLIYEVKFDQEAFKHYNPEWIAVIAPYINKGRIEMRGEEGEPYGYVFRDGKVYHTKTEITWVEEDELKSPI